MASPEQAMLQPNPADPREMEIYATVPEADRQAWLYFVHSSHERESIGIRPSYTFDQFENGVTPHVEGFLPAFDDLVVQGIGGTAIIPNYRSEHAVQLHGEEHIVEPMLGAFNGQKTMIERARAKGPLAIIAPHATLASPYIVTRSLVHTLGDELAKKTYIIIGPRPTVMEYELYDSVHNRTTRLSPVQLGRSIANLILTGPDTDSVRKNNELQEWLKKLRHGFWESLDEIMEPDPNGDNNIIVFCPAGRVSEDGKEFRVDGSFDYLTKYPGLQILPVGVFDRVLQSPSTPSSPVYIHPDASVWNVQKDRHANYLHERATVLSQSPIGGLEFESQLAHNTRLTRQKLRRKTKEKSPPYLSD